MPAGLEEFLFFVEPMGSEEDIEEAVRPGDPGQLPPSKQDGAYRPLRALGARAQQDSCGGSPKDRLPTANAALPAAANATT